MRTVPRIYARVSWPVTLLIRPQHLVEDCNLPQLGTLEQRQHQPYQVLVSSLHCSTRPPYDVPVYHICGLAVSIYMKAEGAGNLRLGQS